MPSSSDPPISAPSPTPAPRPRPTSTPTSSGAAAPHAAEALERLGGARGARRFAAWPDREVPTGSPGLCTVWHEDGRFLYVAAAGSLYSRLKSMAAGRRAGDPFCLLVADRLVLPLLSRAEIAGIAAGRIPFDALLRAHIRRRLLYRFVPLASTNEARGLEATLRRGAWRHGPPLLNPDPAIGS